MKKIFFLLLFCASLTVGYAQKQATVPVAVKTAFAAKYPGVQKVKWSLEKSDEFEAEYKVRGVEASSLFAIDGSFLGCEVEIKRSELPQAVQDALKDFAAYKLDEIEKATDSNNIVTYEMEATKGKEKLEIAFDATGKLVKKEVLKNK